MDKIRQYLLVLLPVILAAPGVASGQENVETALDVEAFPDIEIVATEILGNGCPPGTASALLSDDKRTLSVFFFAYFAENSAYRSCNIGIELRVPRGFSVALLEVDYRGYASIPNAWGRYGQFRTEYFFAGDTGPIRYYNFPPGFDSNFMVSQDIIGAVWSPCGPVNVITRANTRIRTWGGGSFMIIDTADVTTEGVTFYLDWNECH